MTETIGKVTLDLSKYSGKDMYSEGASEDLLLELVRDNPPDDYNRIIGENAGWSTLYHLSDLRGNIVDFLPFSKKDKVLEVGSGCGAITGHIAKKAKSVTCIELSKKRSMINAYRNRERDNIDIKVGNFQDIESTLPKDYDYIMLIGVFEYAASYIQGEKPYETFLEILLSHLKEGGRLVIAIENKYGLKYFAGCREDHLGDFYSGIEGYGPDSFVRTFSRDELISKARKAGCRIKEFYPYPDYKLPVTIYSEDRMPKKGELYAEVPNFDNTRIVAFDEAKAFDELVEDNKFPFFSNSFLYILEKGIRVEGFTVRNPIYSKHSNERSPEYAIRTDIEKDGNGHRYVVKYPLSEKAAEHVASMSEKYLMLLEQYADSVFTPNKYTKSGNAAEFEYIEGESLEERLSKLLAKGKEKQAYKIIDKYAEAIKSLPGGDEKALPYANIDMIFANIIPDAEDTLKAKWIVLDYEWTRQEEVERSFIIYRAFKYFLKAVPEANKLNLYEKYDISADMIKRYEEKELKLQQEIAGERISLLGFYSIFGMDAYKVKEMETAVSVLKRRDRVKVYYDKGNGFNEDDTCYYTGVLKTGTNVILDIPLPEGVKNVRLDPSDDPCMVKISDVSVKEMLVNGCVIGKGMVFYKEPDPQIIFEKVSDYKKLHIEYEIDAVNPAFASEIGAAIYEGMNSKKSLNPFKKKGPYEKLTV